MIQWLLLGTAIVAEVGGTLALRMASSGSKRWYLLVAAAYAVTFVLLGAVLALGMPLGVAYGIWVAVGVALTAILSKVLFDEPFTAIMGLGVVLIAGGVLLIELGAAH